MTDAIPERKRAFLRWLALGPPKREAQAKQAMAAFLPIIETAGFEWVEKTYNGFKPQVHSIELMREHNKQQFDTISIIFDKNRGAKFQIVLGSNKTAPPHRCLRVGRIVWGNSGLDKHNWWGAKWWNFNKDHAFNSGVRKVADALPQAIDFLSDGTVGPQIHGSEIPDNPTNDTG